MRTLVRKSMSGCNQVEDADSCYSTPLQRRFNVYSIECYTCTCPRLIGTECSVEGRWSLSSSMSTACRTALDPGGSHRAFSIVGLSLGLMRSVPTLSSFSVDRLGRRVAPVSSMPVVTGGCETDDRCATSACYVVLARISAFLLDLPVLGRFSFDDGRVSHLQRTESLCGEITGPLDVLLL